MAGTFSHAKFGRFANRCRGEERPLTIAIIDLSNRIYDWTSSALTNLSSTVLGVDSDMLFPTTRSVDDETCIGKPHALGNPTLRP